MKVELVSYTPEPLMTIAKAASNCYGTEPNIKVVDHCYRSGHHSVLEFATFHFHVEGISRACSHQLVRSRIASYAQRSQRYVDENNFQFIVPDSIRNNKIASSNYYNLMRIINDHYQTFIEIGIPSEDARFCLPNACSTTIDIGMNLRSLIHFCEERLCLRSQWEIRSMAQEMADAVRQLKNGTISRTTLQEAGILNAQRFSWEYTYQQTKEFYREIYNN